MYEQTISHALGLHMHQPPGNLKLLIEENPWEAEQIIRCYERAARYAHKYQEIGHLHVGFSGILLEQFLDPEIVDAYRHIIDIPAMLESYRTADNLELIGMGYYHPIFPLIPQQDWEGHLLKGRQIMQQIFGRSPKGFWPPEMAFTMEMIPALVKTGYEYVVVDSVHVQPRDGTQDIYQPYQACHDGACITIIPRDRDLSNAQESGLNPGWFAHEIQQKVQHSPRPHEPRLVTTWSDGENGGWFRQTDESAGFFGYFFAPYMEHSRYGEFPSRTVSLSNYLKEHAPQQQAHVQTGAWNVGDTSGYDFAQWAGSDSQRQAVEKLVQVSDRYRQLAQRKDTDKTVNKLLEQAHQVMLEGQTSCYLFWGDSWIPHLYEHTQQVDNLLDQAEKAMASQSIPQTTPETAKKTQPTTPTEVSNGSAPKIAEKSTPTPEARAETQPAAKPSMKPAPAKQSAEKSEPMPAKRPTPVEKTAEQAKSFPMAEADISQQAVTQTEPAVKPVEVVDPAPKRVDKSHTTGKMGAKTAATPRSDEKAQPTPAKPLSTPAAESPVKKQVPRGKPAASKGKPATKPKSNRRKKGKRR
jgi:hypothetical protein